LKKELVDLKTEKKREAKEQGADSKEAKKVCLH
jgi:hypothetical protein